jgi:hypothetical protein
MCIFEDDIESCREEIEDILDALDGAYFAMMSKQDPHPDLLKRIREILETHHVV